MDSFARALVDDAEWERQRGALEKVAIDQHVRNVAAEIYRVGGRTLGFLENNPVTGAALAGGLVGGAVGAAPRHDKQGRGRGRRFVRGAMGGALAGTIVGQATKGAVSNIGRFGNDVADAMSEIRGSGHGAPWREVTRRELVDAVRSTMGNADSRAGHRVRVNNPSEVARLRDLVAKAKQLSQKVRRMDVNDRGRPDAVLAYRAAAEALNKAKGGAGGGMGLGQATLLLGGTAAGAGLVTSKAHDKEAGLNLQFSPQITGALGKAISYAQNNPQQIAHGIANYGLPLVGGLMGGMQGLQTASMLAPLVSGGLTGAFPKHPDANSNYHKALDRAKRWVNERQAEAT